jgi:hypothetical protein
MATGSQDVSALTLIMSSAVISAVVNVGWNAYAKWGERKKEAAKEAQKVGHVYLALVLQLEGFARQCNERHYDIGIGIERYRTEHDSSVFDGLSSILFEFSPEPDWTALPIPFVAKLKSLTNRFEQCNSWIETQFQLWAGLDEAYELEEERLAYYGLNACKLASEIRIEIEAGDGELGYLITHFQSVIDTRRNSYVTNPGMHTLIPELRAHFESELPSSDRHANSKPSN